MNDIVTILNIEVILVQFENGDLEQEMAVWDIVALLKRVQEGAEIEEPTHE